MAQNLHDHYIDGLTFDASFDSGNAAARVEKLGDNEFCLWTLRDCEGTPHENGCRTWFCFSVRGALVTGRTLAFRIHNMNSQGNLYRHDMRPVYRSLPSKPEWERLPVAATHWGGKAKDKYKEMRENTRGAEEDGFVVRFEHTIDTPADDTLYFAFCFPASYTDSMARLAWLDALFGLPRAPVCAPSTALRAPRAAVLQAHAAAPEAENVQHNAQPQPPPTMSPPPPAMPPPAPAPAPAPRTSWFQSLSSFFTNVAARCLLAAGAEQAPLAALLPSAGESTSSSQISVPISVPICVDAPAAIVADDIFLQAVHAHLGPKTPPKDTPNLGGPLPNLVDVEAAVMGGSAIGIPNQASFPLGYPHSPQTPAQTPPNYILDDAYAAAHAAADDDDDDDDDDAVSDAPDAAALAAALMAAAPPSTAPPSCATATAATTTADVCEEWGGRRGEHLHAHVCEEWLLSGRGASRARMEIATAAVTSAARLAPTTTPDRTSIYYHRELLTRSLDGRRIDLLTISSREGILRGREPPIPELCAQHGAAQHGAAQHGAITEGGKRARLFKPSKRVFLLTSRVHPGETPASHVFEVPP